MVFHRTKFNRKKVLCNYSKIKTLTTPLCFESPIILSWYLISSQWLRQSIKVLPGFFQMSKKQTEHLLPSPPHTPCSDLLPTTSAYSFHSHHSQAIPQKLWVKSKPQPHVQGPSPSSGETREGRVREMWSMYPAV